MLCRFRRISQLYSQGVRPLARDMLELQNWNWLYNATDKLTKGWLTHGARLLQQVTASAKSSDEAMQVSISCAACCFICGSNDDMLFRHMSSEASMQVTVVAAVQFAPV